MFTGIITGWSSVLNTAIPFITILDTNDKITNNSGVLSLNKSGFYDVDANLNLTGVAGDVSVTLYADGIATNIVATATLGTASTIVNVGLTDAIRCVLAQSPSVAKISLVCDTAGVTISGNIRVQYVA